MKLKDLEMRDPFILAEGGIYYLYGTPVEWTDKCESFKVYKSRDLIEFDGGREVFRASDGYWERQFWAPEVHMYDGKYYMFATFYKDFRGTYVLISDSPEGPFLPLSKTPVTPQGIDCLDGTLYIEDGRPYAVYCREWAQVYDGEMWYNELSPDLKERISEPKKLFAASESGWSYGNKWKDEKDCFVTDGPFLYRQRNDKLLLLWSGFTKNGYALGAAVSKNGKISGKFEHIKEPLAEFDGGHAMLFKDFKGDLRLALHRPNGPKGAERPEIYKIEERADSFKIGEKL